MADRVAVLKDGVICQVATPQELYRRPKTAFVAQFIGETNLLPGKIVAADKNLTAVDVGGAMLQAANAPEGLGIGDKVLLSLRPEAFVRPAEAGSQANQLPVTMRETHYLGETADHLAVMEQGQEVRFSELNPLGMMTAGEKVNLQIAAADVVILPAEE